MIDPSERAYTYLKLLAWIFYSWWTFGSWIMLLLVWLLLDLLFLICYLLAPWLLAINGAGTTPPLHRFVAPSCYSLVGWIILLLWWWMCGMCWSSVVLVKNSVYMCVCELWPLGTFVVLSGELLYAWFPILSWPARCAAATQLCVCMCGCDQLLVNQCCVGAFPHLVLLPDGWDRPWLGNIPMQWLYFRLFNTWCLLSLVIWSNSAA